MTRATDLLAVGPRDTPYDIRRAAYAELVVTDIEASERFYVDLLGLVVTVRLDDAIYMRGWEERLHHSLVLRRGDAPGAARLAFRVRSNADLSLLAADFEQRGCEVDWVDGAHSGMGVALRVSDPFGFPLEFFHDMVQFETSLQRFDLQRGAPVMRLDHFNLQVPEVESTFGYWQELGFRCSEYIATDEADERITGAWLLRKPSVHDVALTVGRGPRLHHLGLFVGDFTGVIRACDQLAAAGYPHAIERGPGRHGVSNAFFVYLRDPDGHRIELYACDYYTGDLDLVPIRWSAADSRCRSFWGSRAPTSWYEESSVVFGPDGSQVPTVASLIDERHSHTEVMA